jgi:hypothetical protein
MKLQALNTTQLSMRLTDCLKMKYRGHTMHVVGFLAWQFLIYEHMVQRQQVQKITNEDKLFSKTEKGEKLSHNYKME